jgi:hypothetical protein
MPTVFFFDNFILKKKNTPPSPSATATGAGAKTLDDLYARGRRERQLQGSTATAQGVFSRAGGSAANSGLQQQQQQQQQQEPSSAARISTALREIADQQATLERALREVLAPLQVDANGQSVAAELAAGSGGGRGATKRVGLALAEGTFDVDAVLGALPRQLAEADLSHVANTAAERAATWDVADFDDFDEMTYLRSIVAPSHAHADYDRHDAADDDGLPRGESIGAGFAPESVPGGGRLREAAQQPWDLRHSASAGQQRPAAAKVYYGSGNEPRSGAEVADLRARAASAYGAGAGAGAPSAARPLETSTRGFPLGPVSGAGNAMMASALYASGVKVRDAGSLYGGTKALRSAANLYSGAGGDTRGMAGGVDNPPSAAYARGLQHDELSDGEDYM